MKCPQELSGEAKAAWSRFVDVLDVTEADGPALQVLCETWAEWHEANEVVKSPDDKGGMVIRQPNGWPGPNPYQPIKAKARADLMRMFREFGMTPAARKKLMATEEAEAGELEY